MDEPQQQITWWMLGGIGAVVGALTTAVVQLFHLQQAASKATVDALEKRIDSADAMIAELSKEADKCREDRAALHKENEMLKISIERLQRAGN